MMSSSRIALPTDVLAPSAGHVSTEKWMCAIQNEGR